MINEIRKHLKSHPWMDSIRYFDTIDSTNTRAKLLAAQGAPAGTVLIADHQTGGRDGWDGASCPLPEPGCT